MKRVLLVAGAVMLTVAVTVVVPPAGAQSKVSEDLSSAQSGSGARLSSGRVFFSRELIGRPVISPEDEQLGTIENLVISRNGQVTCIILAPARGVKTKGQFVVIPWETADPELRHDKVVINFTPRRLQDAPTVSSATSAPLQTTQEQRRTNGYYCEPDTEQSSLERQGEWDTCQKQMPLETEPEYGFDPGGREGCESQAERSEDASFGRAADPARLEACYPNHFCTGLGGYDLGLPSWSRMATGSFGNGFGYGGYEVGLIGREAPIPPGVSTYDAGCGIQPGCAAGYGAPCFGGGMPLHGMQGSDGMQSLGMRKFDCSTGGGYDGMMPGYGGSNTRAYYRGCGGYQGCGNGTGCPSANGSGRQTESSMGESQEESAFSKEDSPIPSPTISNQSEMRTNLKSRSVATEFPNIFGRLLPGIALGNKVGTKELLGMPVQNRHGVQLGSIADLLLNRDAEIKYLVLSNANSLEAGGKNLSAIPWDWAQPLIQDDSVSVNVSQRELADAYHFSRNDWRRFQYSKNWEGLSDYYAGALGPSGAAGPGGFRANALIGEAVTDPQGDELGVIRDLFADEWGCLKYAILSPAENMDFGSDRLVAIPWTLVQSLQQGEVVMNVSPYSLMDAPGFSSENRQDYVNNPQFDQRVFTYFGATPRTGMSETVSPLGTGLVSVARAVGQDVANTQGQPLGTLTNLIISRGGRVQYFLVSPQNAMNQRIAIPWDAAAPRFEANAVIVDISRTRFAHAPSFSGGELQQINSPQWESRVNGYFRDEIRSHQQEGY